MTRPPVQDYTAQPTWSSLRLLIDSRAYAKCPILKPVASADTVEPRPDAPPESSPRLLNPQSSVPASAPDGTTARSCPVAASPPASATCPLRPLRNTRGCAPGPCPRCRSSACP